MGTSARAALTGAAVACSAYVIWLTAHVADLPSEGANLGAGFAGLGTAAALGGIVLGLVSLLSPSDGTRTRAFWLTVSAVAGAFFGLALPTLSLIYPNM